ncbi:MAG: hypothetical protein JXJ04_17925 [Spirochaetales bacterium]|nr:hypothetical protein [Spirochaetales bacterium]
MYATPDGEIRPEKSGHGRRIKKSCPKTAGRKNPAGGTRPEISGRRDPDSPILS